MRHFVLHKRCAKLFMLFSFVFLVGCSATKTSGKSYTLVKRNKDNTLIPAKEVFGEDKEALLDTLIADGNAMGITLNTAYIRFLEAVSHPEVAFFVQVKVREKDSPQESMIWEKVYLNTENQNEHIVLSKNSKLPKIDIPLLPAIDYESQDVLISIRIIELDGKDNGHTLQLVNTAASIGAQFYPESAASISVFQTVLSFIAKNNPDDIEFQYDFAISRALDTITYGGKEYDQVFAPRVGTYAVIKTEHEGRMALPDNWGDTFWHGLRFGLAELFKFATLNLFNAGSAELDQYHKFFNFPFGMPEDSTSEPILKKEQLHAKYLYNSRLLRRRLSGKGKLTFENNDLYQDAKKWDSPFSQKQYKQPYRSQSFLIFSIVPSVFGLPIKNLQQQAEQSKVVEALNLQTLGLDTGTRLGFLNKIAESTAKLAEKSELKNKYRKKLHAAKDNTEREKIMQEFNHETKKEDAKKEVKQDSAGASKPETHQQEAEIDKNKDSEKTKKEKDHRDAEEPKVPDADVGTETKYPDIERYLNNLKERLENNSN